MLSHDAYMQVLLQVDDLIAEWENSANEPSRERA